MDKTLPRALERMQQPDPAVLLATLTRGAVVRRGQCEVPGAVGLPGRTVPGRFQHNGGQTP